MEYEPLRKLYYMDEALYAKTYETRFHAEDAVRLDFDIGGPNDGGLATGICHCAAG